VLSSANFLTGFLVVQVLLGGAGLNRKNVSKEWISAIDVAFFKLQKVTV